MIPRKFACGCVVAVIALSPARSQSVHELRVEGGTAQIRQDGRTARNAGLVSALARAGDDHFAGLVSGAFTYAGDSMTAGQAIAALAWRPSMQSAWQTEGGVTGAAFGIYQLGRGGNVSSYLRQRLALPEGGFWVGGAAGHTTRDEISSHSTAVDVGLSVRLGDFETSFSWARVRSDDIKLLEAAGVFLLRDAPAHDFDDRTIALQYQRARVKLDVSKTWREGQRATLANQSALFASAEYTFTQRFSAVVAAGRQLADAVRGVPDVQVVSAALRMVLVPWRGLDEEGAGVIAYASVTPGAEGALLIVKVAAGESQRVQVAGTFSGWEPVPLKRTSEGWEARIVLGSGRYRLGVRVDEGPWRAPANLGKVRDEFGGTSGIIVVP
ncbi:MAG TPA: glycogen-binding domain-containing protein [Gemmatimonadaceae bacterium]|nr:glycogen-binding domain-containing protein [Gemmatimonadaceae bacterium]